MNAAVFPAMSYTQYMSRSRVGTGNHERRRLSCNGTYTIHVHQVMQHEAGVESLTSVQTPVIIPGKISASKTVLLKSFSYIQLLLHDRSSTNKHTELVNGT